ncbi:hypothetical protein EMCRGX_G029225 [Ephydatia muelleri]
MPKVKEKGKEQSLLANEGKVGRRNAPIKEERLPKASWPVRLDHQSVRLDNAHSMHQYDGWEGPGARYDGWEREWARTFEEATLKQQLEVVEGSPDLQGEVKALRAQLLEEQDRTAATKSQVDTLQRGLEEERTKMSQERQRMTEECQAQTKTAEGLVRELEAAKSELTSLLAKQADIHSTTTQLTAEKKNLVATLRQLTDSRDLLQSEVNALQSDLSTVVSEKATYKLATEAAQKEVTSLHEELAKERISHVETKEKLTAVEREAKASSVMDLELADYRRSVEQLRNQLSDRDSKIEAAKREKEEYQKTLEQLKKEMESAALSDRSRYKRYFRTNPSGNIEYPAFRSIMRHFGWKQIAILTQDEDLFTTAQAIIEMDLRAANYTITSRLFETESDPTISTSDFFVRAEDYRVFFLNCYSHSARKIICQAAKQGYTYPYYAWILQDWYTEKWWTASVDGEAINCTDTELEIFLDKALSLHIHPSSDDYFGSTNAGIMPQQFQIEYELRAWQNGYDVSDAGGRAYDAIWVLALALNHTMTMVKSGNINGTHCENVTGSLVPLEQFDYSNEKMGCLIQWNIQQTNISGVSGPIQFDANGTRIQNVIYLKQYQYHGNMTKVQFAYLRTQDYIFNYLHGFSDIDIYPEGIPPDGVPHVIIRTYSIPMVTVVMILSTCGLTFTLICCLFNLIFRNRRVVRLSSSNLNYLIILGAVCMYLSVYAYLVPTVHISTVQIMCVLKEWLFITGYALCFGTVLAKMWRIYNIFQNPTAKKNGIKDWQMLMLVATIVGIGILLVAIGTGVPYLRGSLVTQTADAENPNGIAAGGAREEYYHLVCYPMSSIPFYWKIFILAYLAVLQIVGIVLAFETRKVKFPGLRDSAFVAAIIYISSLVLVMLAVDTFVLSSFLNAYGAIFATGILILTTIFLLLTFVPKMVLLYNDREDSLTTAVSAHQSHEDRIVTLEETIQSRDKLIESLKKEIMALKEKAEIDCSTTV